jgi:hypothetical protein
MNHELRIAMSQDAAMGVLRIDLPDDWVECERSDTKLQLQAPNGAMACYLSLYALSFGRDEAEALESARNTERSTLLQMENRKWECLGDDNWSRGGVRVSVRDHLDVGGAFRIVDKLIVGSGILARAAFHDYDCENYAESKTYLSRAIESLTLQTEPLH